MIRLSIAITLAESTSRDKKGNGNSEAGTSEDGVEQNRQSHPKRSIPSQ